MLRLSSVNVAKYLVAAGCVIAFSEVAIASTFESFCVTASKVESNSSTWSAGYNEIEFVSVDVTSAGILVLDVSTDSTEEGIRVTFLGRGCAELGSADDFVTLEQGGAYQMIAIRAQGTYALRLASAGIGEMLGAYELRSSFVPAEIVEEEGVMELRDGRRMLTRETQFFSDQSFFKSEVEVVDPNPDGLATPDQPFFKSEVEVVDPNPDGLATPDQSFFKSEVEVVDPNPDGLAKPRRVPILSLLTLYTDNTITARLKLFPDEPNVELNWALLNDWAGVLK